MTAWRGARKWSPGERWQGAGAQRSKVVRTGSDGRAQALFVRGGMVVVGGIGKGASAGPEVGREGGGAERGQGRLTLHARVSFMIIRPPFLMLPASVG